MSKGSSKTIYAVTLAWQLGFMIVLPIALALLLGAEADRILGTSPLLLILGIILGLLISLSGTFYLLKPLIKDS